MTRTGGEGIRSRVKRLVPAGSLRRRFASGAAWSTLTLGLAQGARFVGAIVLSRVLGQEVFGQFAILQMTLATLGGFAGLGLSVTATRHVAGCRSSDPERASRVLGLTSLVVWSAGSVATIALYGLAPWLAARTLGEASLAEFLRIGCPIVLFTAVNNTQTGTLIGLERFRAGTRATLMGTVVGFPLLVVGTLTRGLEGAILGLMGMEASLVVFNLLALRREANAMGLTWQLRGLWREVPMLAQFTLPAFLNVVLNGLVLWGGRAFLVNQTDGYTQMGLYTAAQRVTAVVQRGFRTIFQATLPILSEQLGAGQYSAYRRTFRRVLLAGALLAAGVLLPICVASPWIMGVFGESFVSGWPTLVASAAAACFAILASVAGRGIAAAGRMWDSFRFTAIWAIVVVVAVVLVVPDRGALGLALSMALGFAIHFVNQVGFMLRRTDRLEEEDVTQGRDASLDNATRDG